MSFSVTLGAASVAAWLYLLIGRGRFWLERPAEPVEIPGRLPAVLVVVPARNEAESIGPVIAALLAQEYPGDYRVVLVDDASNDGTAECARDAARTSARADRLSIIAAPPLARGWTGKLWALEAGLFEGSRGAQPAELVLFTDADVLHPRDSLAQLVARAERGGPGGGGCDLVSLMVRLRCESAAERLMVPAFVFFFQMLYPFRWSNERRRRTAAAAGGVLLLRRAALQAIGGLAAIRDALIDDCRLAAEVKRSGGVTWIGLGSETYSLRPYGGLTGLWRMIARTAFTQLRCSSLLLAATAVAMLIVFVAPPLLLVSGSPAAAGLGVAAWGMIALAYAPMVRFYGLGPLWSVTLPFTALVYLGATLDSARRHWLGRGGEWKGRAARVKDVSQV